MAEDKDYPSVIKVPSNQHETLFNHSAFTGAIIGDVLTGSQNKFPGMMAGGLIGGLLGRERIARENHEGRPVPKPASPEIALAGGGLTGGALGALVALAVVSGVGLPALGIAAAAGAAVGMLMGRNANQHAQQDYEMAKHYYDEHGLYQGAASEVAKNVNIFVVSPEEAKLLETKLAEHGGSKVDAHGAEKLVGAAHIR